MATVTFKGKPLHTIGNLPAVGTKAPDFTLVKSDLSELHLSEYAGKKVVLNIFPSIDTSVCAASVRAFNAAAASLENTVVLCVSADLPFAAARFCGAEGIENVETGSTFRSTFGTDYNVAFAEGQVFSGLLSRAVIILNEAGEVIYTEQVHEIGEEPDYEAALKALE
ncbi:thiol peroxidase [Chitinivibrio alkaliphilus]|uniref:Thiol peroxidase n=1 Tax=Chitinivibrio alkaliphilus ACht1 TaxID=1313304 RepID=U7DBU4_9BACT|nr:thiol peroxidase [Chitinivibrio alkaliphilus]ERP39053.1 thiol peroxidase [Chitinivibrio alkaliphilus ACht1]